MRKNSDFQAFFEKEIQFSRQALDRWSENFYQRNYYKIRVEWDLSQSYSHKNRNYDFMANWTWRWITSYRVISWGSPRLATRLLDPSASYFWSILAMGPISCVHVGIRSCYKPCEKKKSKIKLPFLKRNLNFSTTTWLIELKLFTEKLLSNTRRMSPIPKFYSNYNRNYDFMNI